jgi:hypothetical protein
MDNPVIDSDRVNRWVDSDGEIHRVDGPAFEYTDDYKVWYQHGKVHRVDGPAVEWADGDMHWYQHNKRLSFDQWLDEVDITDEAKVMMKLIYG